MTTDRTCRDAAHPSAVWREATAFRAAGWYCGVCDLAPAVTAGLTR